jgi:ABC-2 type transport system permease protein
VMALGRVAAIVAKDFRQYYGKAPVVSWGLLFPLTLTLLLGYYAAGMGAWRTVPGLIAVSVLFSASSMSQVAVSFDKMSGGFEVYMHAPLRPSAVALAKALGGFAFGLLGAGVAASTLYLVAGALPLINPAYLAAGVVLASLAFSLVGEAVSLVYEPVQAVTVLNALRFAMVFLGGLLPAHAIPAQVRPALYMLPMAYASDLIRYGSFNIYEYMSPTLALLGLAAWATALWIVSWVAAERTLYP